MGSKTQGLDFWLKEAGWTYPFRSVPSWNLSKLTMIRGFFKKHTLLRINRGEKIFWKMEQNRANSGWAEKKFWGKVKGLFTPWTAVHKLPLLMQISRQEYWSGLPYLPPGNCPNLGIKPVSPVTPALQEDSWFKIHEFLKIHVGRKPTCCHTTI